MSDAAKTPEYEMVDQRFEIIDGVEYMLSAPSAEHQEMVGMIYEQLKIWFRDKSCKVYLAPVAVHLFKNEDEIQPDLFVLCDKSKIVDGKVMGAPDLVVEVVSPSSDKRDLAVKPMLCKKAGVKEYWAVDRDSVVMWDFKNDTVSIVPFEVGSVVKSSHFQGLEVERYSLDWSL